MRQLIILFISILFVSCTLAAGASKSDYYDSDDYDGNGTAH